MGPTERGNPGSQEPGLPDLFDLGREGHNMYKQTSRQSYLGFRSIEGLGEIGERPGLRELGRLGGNISTG